MSSKKRFNFVFEDPVLEAMFRADSKETGIPMSKIIQRALARRYADKTFAEQKTGGFANEETDNRS